MASRDMTTGSPLKVIFYFTIPLLIGNVFQQFYNFADTLIVGRTLGVKALASVGSTGAISWLVVGFIQGITVGFSVVTAQRFGAYDIKGVKKSVATSITLCVFWTIILTLIMTLTAKDLLLLLETPDDIVEGAYDYIFYIYLGLGATVFYNMISNIIRALGDSKTPLFFLVIAAFLNIGLDFLFIKQFNMGVGGAGLATVISQFVSGFLCLIFVIIKLPILHLSWSDFKIDIPFSMKHLKIGFPMGFQMSILTIGIITVQFVLNGFGSDIVAGFTAAAKVDQLAGQMIVTLGVAMSTFAAQNYGAKNYRRIRVGVKKCIAVAFAFSVIGFIIIFSFGKSLVEIFISEEHSEIIKISETYLKVIIPFYFLLGLLIVYRSSLQGMGYSIFPMWGGIVELFMRAFVALIFGKYFGYIGVCFASPAAWFGATVLLRYGYYKTIKNVTFNAHRKIRLSLENILGIASTQT